MYEMPPAVKFISHNKWAWQLKETIEEAHKFVRENINTAMIRLKRYHDQKLSWQVFKPDDYMYVYFPLRKEGRSPKFTSYWQGSFKIISKMTDLTYKVDCGARGKPEVVHVARLRQKHDKILRGEVVDKNALHVDANLTDNSISHDEVFGSEDAEIVVNNDVLIDSYGTCSTRVRRQHKWLDDYVRW